MDNQTSQRQIPSSEPVPWPDSRSEDRNPEPGRSFRRSWRVSLYLGPSRGGRAAWTAGGGAWLHLSLWAGAGGTMLLLTLLTGTFGSSESLMWLCERPALTEVRDERRPRPHWKLNARPWGAPSGPGLVLCPRGIDNEASVLTCTERRGSLSRPITARATFLIWGGGGGVDLRILGPKCFIRPLLCLLRSFQVPYLPKMNENE